MKINRIIVTSNGQATPQGERLMELCHQAAGMGCWHNVIHDTNHTIQGRPYSCASCNKRVLCSTELNNPAYLTSLDVVQALEVAVYEMGLWKDYEHSLIGYYEDTFIIPYCGKCKDASGNWHTGEGGEPIKAGKCSAWHTGAISFLRVPAYVRLWRLARVLTVECPEHYCEQGVIQRLDPNQDTQCVACSGTGRISVLDQWLKEMEEGV